MNRRTFLKEASTLGSAALFAPSLLRSFDFNPSQTTQVAFVKTADRAAGVARAMDLLGLSRLDGKDFFIKPNFNSADATPGSTSEETLAAIVKKLKTLDAGPMTIGDRSGMGNTWEVMEKKKAFILGKELGAKVVGLRSIESRRLGTSESSEQPLAAGLRYSADCPPGWRNCADMLPEDASLRRTLYPVAQELRWACRQNGARQRLQLHA